MQRPTNKQQLNIAVVKVWQYISREDTKHLVCPFGVYSQWPQKIFTQVLQTILKYKIC